MTSSAPWPAVAIVGVGMIGGSIGKALLARRLAGRVVGVGRSAESLGVARTTGCITDASLEIDAVADADVVIVAAGVKAIPDLLDAVDAVIRPGTLVTDAGSTKATIVSGWERRRRSRRGRFVGSHPIAGSHRRGPGSADAELFEGRTTVVTPSTATPAEDAEAVGELWASLGSTVFMMPPRVHDRILAGTSHAPHLIAAALAAATPPESRTFTAGGWRDTTRIAAGDPELWADILLDNAPAVAAAMGRFAAVAEKLLLAIEAGDRRRLVSLLKRAKDHRDAVGS